MGFPVQVLAERVVNSIPEGVLIAAFAWLLLKLVGRQNSGTRFAVWFTTLVAISLVPFVPMMRGSVAHAAHAEIALPGEWAIGILAAWGLISFFGLARIVFGMMRISSLREKSVVVDVSELTPELAGALEACLKKRPVEIRVSSEIRVPTALGFLNPTILLPEWSLRDLSPDELRAVILHESAHLVRRDDWTNLAQKILRAIFFFHPAVLWVEKKLSLEREMACDDAVLASTGNPRGYAQCLVSLAEKSLLERSVALAQAVIGRAKETTLRVAQILDLDRPKATRVFKPVIGAVAAAVVIAVIAMPRAPKLVSFERSNETAEEAPQIAKSIVVPAKFVEKTEPQVSKAEFPPAEIGDSSVHSRLATTNAKQKVQSDRPRVVLAKFRQAPAQEQMLVYTETTNYYRQGTGIVGITEWKLMLVTMPRQKAPGDGAPSRT